MESVGVESVYFILLTPAMITLRVKAPLPRLFSNLPGVSSGASQHCTELGPFLAASKAKTQPV